MVRLSNTWRKKIYINFSLVKQVRKSDLMVLMAQLEKLLRKKKQIILSGSIPKNILGLLHEKVIHLKVFNNENIAKNANVAKETNPIIVENVVINLKKIGISRKSDYGFTFYERIKALLTEIMGNAVEHGIRNKNINYWLTSEINTKNKQITVTFVDMGRGIAYSHKKSKLPLKYRIMGLFSDNKIVLKSLLGKLPSSTQNSNRGKGLPEIREIVKKGIVSDFILITNRTLIQYNNNQFITNRIVNFKGTYYSWTINKNNFEKWKTMF
jgi:hypothetical protein